MDNEIKAWLYDILKAIVEIESFFEGQKKNLPIIQRTYAPNALWNEISKL